MCHLLVIFNSYLPHLLKVKTCKTQLPISLTMNNSECDIDLKVLCNSYVLTELMLGPYHTEILQYLQQAHDLEHKSKKITERVGRRGDLIVGLRNYSRARIARSNTKKLRRLQTIDKRRAKALLMMARQVKDKMFKKIEFVVRKKYP